ncbi:Kef family K(+) transporter [Pseudomonas sp. LTJR-52]|uniref:YbaL family putative K(+) efflux transporter n=1 Tax=Pseudomonas sp. LTJR-52 TaxID=2479392 RepID=UPI000EFAF3DC|nr:YbaL family putative K(+) efflux transporter [Pseudomonas sp. LTJR-52]AYN92607.1 Kef family K(+) transporter [Pseudomonas sp. LTJR-52]
MHEMPLITTLAAGLVLAFFLGLLANRLRLPPLAGYLLAGVLAGPFTPGFVADSDIAHELSEIGVILLMFGVGLHFSIKDLMSVRKIAIPGAIGQIAVATLMGMGLAHLLGWGLGTGLVFGLSLSVASTVVLLRAMEERQMMESRRGRIAVGWLIVEDLMMVLALVLLPALSGMLGGKAAESDTSLSMQLLLTLVKVSAFVALMLIVGRRVVPWLLKRVARTGSRELFTLAVLALAMGIAFGSSVLFGVSFALGAFFAGMVLNESELSHEAADNSLPLREAFAVLFFFSVGMLFNPEVLLSHPLHLLATVLIIIVGKSLAALIIVLLARRPLSVALTISASLAQIGEFSFILASLGVSLELLPEEGRDLILGGAIISIILNPALFSIIDRLQPWLERREGQALPNAKAPHAPEVVEPPPITETDHVVLVGHGRVGRLVSARLRREHMPFVVIENDRDHIEELRADQISAVLGNAAQPNVLQKAHIEQAHTLLIAIPNGIEACEVSRRARELNASLNIVSRAHYDELVQHLQESGANVVIMGEREIARGMFTELGLPTQERGEDLHPHPG